MNHVASVIFVLGVLLVGSLSSAHGQTTPPKLGTRLVLARSKSQAGRLISASLVVDIPPGYHLNAHNPISRFALPTKIEVQVPGGYSIGPISYPLAVVRKFSFAEERLGVYEKRAVIRFGLKTAAHEHSGTTTIKVTLNYQSCSDQVCFPPKKEEVSAVLRINNLGRFLY